MTEPDPCTTACNTPVGRPSGRRVGRKPDPRGLNNPLAIVLLFLPVLAHAGARDGLDYFFDAVNTYSARFEQTVLDEGLNTLEESGGRMWISRPGRFRWEYDPPYEQLIVGDGKKIWMYDVELEQVTVRDSRGALGETPAALLAGDGKLKDKFSIKVLNTQGKIAWLRLTPKKKDAAFEDIRVGFEGRILRTMELVDGLGQVTRIRFLDAQENPELTQVSFVFEPPPGVDVIGDP